MPIKIELLRKKRFLANGTVRAQCPACHLGGMDEHGDHLSILPDGRYTCILFTGHSGDAQKHRREIFKLVGDHGKKRHIGPLAIKDVSVAGLKRKIQGWHP